MPLYFLSVGNAVNFSTPVFWRCHSCAGYYDRTKAADLVMCSSPVLDTRFDGPLVNSIHYFWAALACRGRENILLAFQAAWSQLVKRQLNYCPCVTRLTSYHSAFLSPYSSNLAQKLVALLENFTLNIENILRTVPRFSLNWHMDLGMVRDIWGLYFLWF